MHHELLQDALQEEEARAVVIEVEPEPSKEEEEFYAADFEEDYGQGHYYEDDEDEPDREETPTGSEDEAPCLCQQMVTLEVDGELMTVHTPYDWGSTVNLVRNDTTRESGLRPIRVPRQIVRGYKGKETMIDNCFYLPLLDDDGDVVCAYGVDDIVTVARSRPPWDAGDIFPVVKAFIPWMSMDGGPVELLIKLDNTQ